MAHANMSKHMLVGMHWRANATRVETGRVGSGRDECKCTVVLAVTVFPDEKEKHELKLRLVKEFEIKELGKLKYFLGLEMTYSTQRIFISQQKYVINLLAETEKTGCKPIASPIDPNYKLGEAKEEPAVDKRIEPHLQTAYRVLHYLKGNSEKGILFKRNDTLTLKAYTDADYAGSIVDRRSTTRYCTFLGGNLVTWRSKKQNVVTWSSAESEFRAIAQGLCELLWLRIILDDLRIPWEGPMKL
ncbi:uncharacterized protein LOC110025061 [Phalaenopsis equestris]|uniref:uncharacterized protein LOC110025061 n=1 Tax=Phalaenopsis equestris TaxID=78828 RepID=UPI0009E35499|nr:uncharacterized protein LOC110025061 [Phalaenopsis equestris]